MRGLSRVIKTSVSQNMEKRMLQTLDMIANKKKKLILEERKSTAQVSDSEYYGYVIDSYHVVTMWLPCGYHCNITI